MKSNSSNEFSPKQAPHFLILLLLYFCSMSASTMSLVMVLDLLAIPLR